MPEIKGKIVRILSDTEVVINRGLSHGVGYGMEFVIYERGDAIIDSDSQEILEHIEVIKERVFVTHIQDHICTAQTAPADIDLIQAKTVRPKLNVAPQDITPPNDISQRIKVGDPVRNIER